MLHTLTRIYGNTKNKIALENAVKLGWITREQMENIILEAETE